MLRACLVLAIMATPPLAAAFPSSRRRKRFPKGPCEEARRPGGVYIGGCWWGRSQVRPSCKRRPLPGGEKEKGATRRCTPSSGQIRTQQGLRGAGKGAAPGKEEAAAEAGRVPRPARGASIPTRPSQPLRAAHLPAEPGGRRGGGAEEPPGKSRGGRGDSTARAWPREGRSPDGRPAKART